MMYDSAADSGAEKRRKVTARFDASLALRHETARHSLFPCNHSHFWWGPARLKILFEAAASEKGHGAFGARRVIGLAAAPRHNRPASARRFIEGLSRFAIGLRTRPDCPI
jgi:hypothetical protein